MQPTRQQMGAVHGEAGDCEGACLEGCDMLNRDGSLVLGACRGKGNRLAVQQGGQQADALLHATGQVSPSGRL